MPIRDLKAELEKLLERLHNPVQLRVLITALMVLVGYFAIYGPLDRQMQETARHLDRDRKRQALAKDIQQLRAEVEKFQDRLPEDTDTNEWVQYVLGGIRKFPLRLVNLDSDSPQRVGPYEAIVLHVELAGTFHDLDAFLHWLETNRRLFRVDSAKILPSRSERGGLVMRVTVLGAKA